MAEENILQKSILEILGLENLPTERQAALLEKMTELVMKRLMVRAIEEIKEEDKKEAERVFTSGADEEKMNFLKEKIDFERLMQEEILKLKQEMAEEAQKAAL